MNEETLKYAAKQLEQLRKPELAGRRYEEKYTINQLLYPDFPRECGHPEFTGQICIGENCIYAVDGDWEKCHYAKKMN